MRYSTKQSKVIYDIINSSSQHMTAEQIYRLAKLRLPNIAVGTVYRNLGLMCDVGDIRKIEIINAPDRYDKNAKIPHEHLICDRCGALSDISMNGMRGFIVNATGLRDFTYELNIHSLCPECRGREENDGIKTGAMMEPEALNEYGGR